MCSYRGASGWCVIERESDARPRAVIRHWSSHRAKRGRGAAEPGSRDRTIRTLFSRGRGKQKKKRISPIDRPRRGVYRSTAGGEGWGRGRRSITPARNAFPNARFPRIVSRVVARRIRIRYVSPLPPPPFERQVNLPGQASDAESNRGSALTDQSRRMSDVW